MSGAAAGGAGDSAPKAGDKADASSTYPAPKLGEGGDKIMSERMAEVHAVRNRKLPGSGAEERGNAFGRISFRCH